MSVRKKLSFKLGEFRLTKSNRGISPVSLLFILSVTLLSFFGYSLQNTDILGEFDQRLPELEEGQYIVTSVVDGDTLHVIDDTGEYTVRLLGIDTPETVHPNKEVEYFGQEASDYLTELVEGKKVLLISDSSQLDIDRYGRLLRYVYLEDNTFVNELMISEGYAYEYTYDKPYLYQEDFKNAQRKAQELNKGLWHVNPRP